MLRGDTKEASRLATEFERDAQRLHGFEPPGARLGDIPRVAENELEQLGRVSAEEIDRFHWEVTEDDLNSVFESHFHDLPPELWRTGEGRVFVLGAEAPPGRLPGRTPAARTAWTKPDAYHPGTAVPYHPPVSLEAKNWRIGQSADDFVYSTARQALDRAEHLPLDAQQWVIIDLRGQRVAAEELERIRGELERLSGGNLRRSRIIVL
jgi:hypothetical protein